MFAQFANPFGHQFRYSRKNDLDSKSFGHVFRYFAFYATFDARSWQIADQMSVRTEKTSFFVTIAERMSVTV